MGGYQWYFYNRPWFHLGVAIKAHIGYTNYNVNLSDYQTNRGMTFDITAHGIQYGLEAQFLWDFLNKGNHSLGVSVAPLGFEGSTILWSIKGRTDYWYVPNYITIRLSNWNTNLENQTTFTYTFSGGIHYVYNINHKVFIYYKYRYYSDISAPSLGGFSLAFAPSHTLMTGYAYKF